jgi:hypothetical protein
MRNDLIRVNLDVKSLGKPIDEVVRQAPFIFALALTRTAQDCQGEIKGSLGDHFEIRRQWITRGIRSSPGPVRNPWNAIAGQRVTKTHLKAEVGSVDEFMGLHATGGVQKPKPGSKSMAIPVPGGGRPKPEDETPPRTWPGRILGRANKQSFERWAKVKAGGKKRRSKPKPFVATINDHPGVYIRAGRGRFPIKALWIFRKSAKQPADWPFWKQVQATVDRVWNSNVVLAMDETLEKYTKGMPK